MFNSKENYLEAIYFGSPDYVPLTCEMNVHRFELAGNFRIGDWTDLWGVDWEVGIEGTVPFPKGNPLQSLEMLDGYTPPSPSDLLFTEEIKLAYKSVDRGQKVVIGHLMYLLFERVWAIMGMYNYLVSLITHPEESHRLLHMIATYARGVFDRYLELGVDGVSFSEDLGSQRALMTSPEMFREFILPEYEYIFENVLKEGKIIDFHSCGCVDAVAADLAEIGITVLNPIQARANDLRKIKSNTVGKMALKGGIDTAVLARGTPIDVKNEVLRVMEILKADGGYICGPDQGIPGIPEENMEALWTTAREIGRYGGDS